MECAAYEYKRRIGTHQFHLDEVVRVLAVDADEHGVSLRRDDAQRQLVVTPVLDLAVVERERDQALAASEHVGRAL